MIDYEKYRPAVAKGVSNYVGVPVIRGNQSAPAPPYPYLMYNITTPAGKNDGTWQQHDDGIDRLMVKSIWSITSISDDYDQSVTNAMKAREWIMHVGRAALSAQGITVQSVTEINNRDNVLTVEYERKNGFDVVFYVYDAVSNPTTGIIDNVGVAHDMKA